MPVSTQTRAVSPVTLARHSARGRLLRRAVALVALGLFVAGMLVAAGFGTLVLTALPFVAAGLVAAGAAWLLWYSRPWRIVFLVARGVARLTSSAARTVTAAPPALRVAAVRAREFLERPREPWRPPPALVRVRSSATELVARSVPVRQEAHRRWRAVATAGALRGLALGAQLERRIRRATSAWPPPER